MPLRRAYVCKSSSLIRRFTRTKLPNGKEGKRRTVEKKKRLMVKKRRRVSRDVPTASRAEKNFSRTPMTMGGHFQRGKADKGAEFFTAD